MKEEKYIKEKLGNYDSPLDMDLMWSNLETTLDNKKDKPAALFNFRKWFGLLGLVLLVGSLAWWCSSSMPQITNTSQSSVSSLSKTSLSKTDTESITKTSAPSITLENQNISKTAKDSDNTKATKGASAISSKRGQSELQKTNSKVNATSVESRREFNTTPTSQSSVKNTTPTVSNTNRNTQLKDDIQLPILEQKNDKRILANAENLEIETLTSLSKVQLQLLDYTRSTPRANKITLLNTPTNKWSFNVHTGQSFSSFNFKNNLQISDVENEQLIAMTDRLISTSSQAQKRTNNLTYGIDIQRNLNSKWFLKTGINVINHGTSYSFRDTITLDRQPLQDLEKKARIDIIGFNKLRTIQVPLSLGRTFSNNKFDFSISAGIAANYLNRLEASQFENIDLSSIQLLDQLELYKSSKVVLSGLGQMDIGYSLTDNLGVTLGLQGGRTADVSQNSQEEVSPTKININYWGLRAGIKYSL